MEELVEGVLLRFPPSDPASLVRAALVCKDWCRIVFDPGFRRRFRELHRTPPMLGFLCNLRDEDGDGDSISRFVPTSSFWCPEIDHHDWRALDARHGRVLMCSTPWGSDLFIWDPVSDEWREVPPPSPGERVSWNAAVLCAAHGGACDHLDCRNGPFRVVLVEAEDEQMSEQLSVRVYSSEADAWGEPIHLPEYTEYGVDMVPTALVGNALYFLIDASCSILEYDLVTQKASVFDMPELVADSYVLTTMEDGGLGVAMVMGSRLYHWSMEFGPDGDVGWAQIRAIQLETLLPVDGPSISSDFVGFAHGVGIYFVGTAEGLFTIDLKSNQVEKVAEEACGDDGINGVVPFTSFYMPGESDAKLLL
ncbi:hypothetical protein ACP70R_026739 [Stipagrostis hirtigluma subsp. patula]